MIAREKKIITASGEMSTFIVHPDEGGPFPIILFLMDAPGKREELHDMAIRLATSGYYVMLPNLYYRRHEFFINDGSESSRREMFDSMHSLKIIDIIGDCRCLLGFANDDETASKGPAGTVGYCMSGPFAFAAAGMIPDRILAAASIYGVRLMTDEPDSPHLMAKNIEGEIYFAIAEVDPWISNEMITKTESYLKNIDIKFRMELYSQTEHGFAFPQRKAYNKIAAERHWARLLSLFKRNLGASVSR
jgi:carboxymethylenebutenolidase